MVFLVKLTKHFRTPAAPVEEPNCRAPRREAAVPGENPGGDHDRGLLADQRPDGDS